MGFRKTYGGLVETAANKAVDDLFAGEELSEKIGKLVAEQVKKIVGDNLRDKIKANYIDLIDGEDDIPDV